MNIKIILNYGGLLGSMTVCIIYHAYLLAHPELTSVLPFDDIGPAVLMAY